MNELPDITRHVEAFITATFDRISTERGGAEYVLSCPFCSGEADKKKTLYVNHKTGRWICFKCERKGGFVWLVKSMAQEDKDIDPDEFLSGLEEARLHSDALALFSWAAQHGGKKPSGQDKEPSARLQARTSRPIPAGLVPVWRPHEAAVAERRRVRGLAYLATRGIGLPLAEFYQIHVGAVGRYENRVAVPVLSADTREIVGWVARAFRPGVEPKVLNTPSDSTFSIDDHLFNREKAQGSYREVILVEGVFDAMKHGPNFLALLGKSLKKRQLLALLRAKFEKITVMLDRDAPTHCRDLARSLKMHCPEVRYSLLTEVKDPGEASREQVLQALAVARRV